MIINQQILDALTAQAKVSPQLRMNLDLRNSQADQSQRMLYAIEPVSLLPFQRHILETVVCLRRRTMKEFYENRERTCTEAIKLMTVLM